MVKLLQVDGIIRDVKPTDGTKLSLKELQAFVSGYIELITLPDNYVMIVNEDGLNKQLPINQAVMELFGRRLVGDVLVCLRTELN